MYDVLIIGGGPGGYAAAIRAAQLGGSVGLIDASDLGGTCVNRGCIPSKIWMRAAYIKNMIEHSEEFGLKTAAPGLDLNALVNRKKEVGQGIRGGMTALLKKNKVEVITGRAVLKGSGEVAVDNKRYAAKNIIIATGSSISVPEIKGLKDALLTSDELFDLTDLPKTMLVLGDGPIEVELASLMVAFGTKTTLVIPGRRILPNEDHDTSLRLTLALQEQGLAIVNNSVVESVGKSENGFQAVVGDKALEADRILVAKRQPNTSNLGLEAAGIKTDENGFIAVNNKLETSAKGVYAIGDVTGGWMLSHAASAMAIAASENAMGGDSSFRSSLVPRGLWTSPEMAAVGLTEEEAEKAGYDVEVGDFPYPVNGLAMLRGQVDGGVKIISDAEHKEILGVHIVGAGATEIIGEAVMALQLECTAEELAHTMRLHPTFSECIMDSARDVEGWALYLPPK
ncbi:MAG: dihydrolipoyl dehydrogenase [Desulfobacteraceae bacterium]|nr:dihydrolipoyl dehydrogenase [Desulfobacteraceae bacterium]